MSNSTRGPESFAAGPLPPDFFEEEREPVSLFTVGSLFLRNLRWVFGLPILAFVLVAGATTLLRDREYATTSKFMPTTADQWGGTLNRNSGGLLSQLGQLAGGSTGPTPHFYSALLTSGALLREAARDTYHVTLPDSTEADGTVAELHGLDPVTPEANVAASQGIIRRGLVVGIEPGTGFVTLTTKDENLELALGVNRRLLELINQFNVEQRQNRAGIERQFVAERLAEAEEALHAAEDELQAFLHENQRYEQSSRLWFEGNRLQRQVDLRQQLYTSLAQSYQQARINEVRNTPVTTVVEWPEENVQSVRGRSAVFNGFLAAVVALLLAVGLVLARAFLERHRTEHPEDYEEFREVARTKTRSLLPRPVRDQLGSRHSEGEGSSRGGGGSGAEGEDGVDVRMRDRELDAVGGR